MLATHSSGRCNHLCSKMLSFTVRMDQPDAISFWLHIIAWRTNIFNSFRSFPKMHYISVHRLLRMHANCMLDSLLKMKFLTQNRLSPFASLTCSLRSFHVLTALSMDFCGFTLNTKLSGNGKAMTVRLKRADRSMQWLTNQPTVFTFTFIITLKDV